MEITPLEVVLQSVVVLHSVVVLQSGVILLNWDVLQIELSSDVRVRMSGRVFVVCIIDLPKTQFSDILVL